MYHDTECIANLLCWHHPLLVSLYWWLHARLQYPHRWCTRETHYTDIIMTEGASQITSLTIVYSAVYSDGDQRKHQSSASLAFVRGIHRRPVNSPCKGPVTRKMFPFDDVIMYSLAQSHQCCIFHISTSNYCSVTTGLLFGINNDCCRSSLLLLCYKQQLDF